jgi:hypothetical protein
MHAPCLTGRISRSDHEAGTLFRPGVDRNAPYWSCIGGGNGGARVRPRAVVTDSW